MDLSDSRQTEMSGISSIFIYTEWPGKSSCRGRTIYIGRGESVLFRSGNPT